MHTVDTARTQNAHGEFRPPPHGLMTGQPGQSLAAVRRSVTSSESHKRWVSGSLQCFAQTLIGEVDKGSGESVRLERAALDIALACLIGHGPNLTSTAGHRGPLSAVSHFG